MEQPNYYAILTAEVRYDKTLDPMAKILFAEITALSNAKGYCWASNKYFADLFGYSRRQIIRWINDLIGRGLLTRDVIRDGKSVKERHLRLVTPMSLGSVTDVTRGSDTDVTENTKSINTKQNIEEADSAETAASYIFKHGVSALIASGIKEAQARSFLGKVRKQHGDEKVAEVIRSVEKNRPSDPIPYMTKALTHDNGRRKYDPKLLARERVDFFEREIVNEYRAYPIEYCQSELARYKEML